MSNRVLDKKLSHWKQQLLDLSKRNRMINFKESRLSTLKIMKPECLELYERIVDKEEELSFKRAIDEHSTSKVNSIVSLLSILNEPINVTIGDIETNSSVSDMQKTLKNLRSKSKLSLEEQGSNILYLCIGFIEWSTNVKNYKTKSVSPLVLVPVSIQMTALNAPFTLKRYDDDVVLNPTLSYLFENELGYKLPEFDSDEDTIDSYLQKAEKFADAQGWRLIRAAALGLMSFQKISMYMDIEKNTDRLRSNPVINALAGDSSMMNYSSIESADIDSIHPSEIFEVLNADSSQQEAILCSKQGLSFVMQGPPGTGKSQTIANIISEALGDGKKVLFVSEKMAALQVVYKRLEETHLADFCLPLHSYKANKKEIIQQLGRNLELSDLEVNDEVDTILESLYVERNELNSYAEALHKKIEPIGMSCYEIYIKLLALKEVDNVNYELPDFEKIDRTTLHMYLRELEKYQEAVANIGFNVNNNPWKNLKITKVGIEYLRKFSSVLHELHTEYAEIIPLSAELEEVYHIDEEFLCSDLIGITNELLKFNWVADIPAEWFSLKNVNELISSLDKLGSYNTKIKDDMSSIDIDFYPGIAEYDVEEWIRKTENDISRLRAFIDVSENTAISDNALLIDKNNELSSDITVIKQCMKDVENIYHVEFVDSIDGAVIVLDFLKLVLNRYNYVKHWFNADSITDIIKLAEKYEKYSLQAKKLINTYGDEWDTGVLNLDIEALINEFNSGYIDKLSYKYLGKTIDEYSELKVHIERLNHIITELKNDYSLISDETGIKITPKDDAYIVFSELIELIDCNIMIMPEWFSDAKYRSDLNENINDAEKISDKIKNLENKILVDWERNSFELEYDRMLQRFQDDYKGILRYFKRIYRDDRKSIQALSKSSESKKLTDNDIIEFLNLLKEYKESVDKLHSYNLSYKLGELYNEEKTDWESVKTGLRFVEKIISIIGELPKKLVDVISSIEKRHILVSHVNETISKIQSNQESLSEICGVLEIPKYSDYNDFMFRINSFLNEYLKYEEKHKKYVSDICQFSKINGKKYSDEYVIELLESIREHKDAKELFSENNALLCSSFETEYKGINTNWHELIEALKNAERIRSLLGGVSEDTLNVLCSDIGCTMSDKMEQVYQKLNDALLNYERNSCLKFEDKVRQRKLDYVQNDLQQIADILVRLSALYADIKPYCRRNIGDLTASIKKVSDHRTLNVEVLKIEKYIQSYLGDFKSADIDKYDDLIEKLKIVAELKKSIFPEQFYKLISSGKEKRIRLSEICHKLQELYPGFIKKSDWVNEQFDEEYCLKTLPFSQSYEKISSCIENFEQLEFWINFRRVREECCKSVLKKYIEEIERNEQFDYVTGSFMRTFYMKLLDYTFSHEASLSGFKRNSHERLINNFRKDDEMQLLAAQARLRSMLIEQLPSSNSLIRVNDELSVLQKELNKRQKHMPLRKLFRMIPNLLIRLKPCLMMSPLSVSYFLEAETYNFDLVIFDEASQILPEDAIGAILRGKQVIIAGDIKQMPPTSFFSSSVGSSDFDSDNDEEEDVIASSILEEAAGTLPNKTLLWHYRSKHESLIAFSNNEIYNNKLITFPNSAVYKKDMGVEYIYVEDGVYEGGGKNCNIKEAKECVKQLKKQIIEHPERSLGIIAFSEKQQGVIQREVDNFRIENPQFESFFESDTDEPFFVKNLENVQGDERDTIIFSICYAKDVNGRFYMRFGPLGQQGGERRLNVAVTRAKCNIKLVGSILPEELDINRVKADGVKMLRRYIEYAIHGESRLSSSKKSVLFSKDEFCDIVADFITGEGFSIRRNVGCSDNKVDIAVVDPENGDSYIAGIECDGYSYKKAKTARDRDSLRYSMMSRMGWRMYRVWSTEWVCNEQNSKNQLLSFLNDVKSNYESSVTNEKHTMLELVKTVDRHIDDETNNPSGYGLSEYKVTPYSSLKPIRGIYDYSTIAVNIMCILSYEQPVSLNLIYRRIVSAFGIEKMTEKYKTAVSMAIKNELAGKAELDNGGFLWSLPMKRPEPRIPSDAETIRKIEDIPTEEIEELMKIILSNAYGLEVNDLITECSAVFGYERRGARINSTMNTVIDRMKNRKTIEIVDGKIHFVGEKNHE